MAQLAKSCGWESNCNYRALRIW